MAIHRNSSLLNEHQRDAVIYAAKRFFEMNLEMARDEGDYDASPAPDLKAWETCVNRYCKTPEGLKEAERIYGARNHSQSFSVVERIMSSSDRRTLSQPVTESIQKSSERFSSVPVELSKLIKQLSGRRR